MLSVIVILFENPWDSILVPSECHAVDDDLPLWWYWSWDYRAWLELWFAFSEDPNETTDLIDSEDPEHQAAKDELVQMIQDAVHADSYYVSIDSISLIHSWFTRTCQSWEGIMSALWELCCSETFCLGGFQHPHCRSDIQGIFELKNNPHNIQITSSWTLQVCSLVAVPLYSDDSWVV